MTFWVLTEPPTRKSGICESINLSAIVTFSGPFKATVEVEATTGLGFKVRNTPWSRDDPLLFDGRTSKGRQPQLGPEFNKLSDQGWINHIVYASSPSSNTMTVDKS